MTITESKTLKTGNRVGWGGNAADCGQITETSWSSASIAWDNNHIAVVHHGDVREFTAQSESLGLTPRSDCERYK